MKVTLYSLPASVCVGCKFTKRALGDRKIPYQEVPIASDPEALAYIKSLDYTSAPVVVVEMGDGAVWTWSGYRPSQIDLLAEQFA